MHHLWQIFMLKEENLQKLNLAIIKAVVYADREKASAKGTDRQMKSKIVDSTIGIFLIIGIIFVLVGGIFTGVGIATFFWNAGPDMIFFQLIFGGIGLPLFIIGIICLLYSIRRRNRINSLISFGKYVMAEVARVN